MGLHGQPLTPPALLYFAASGVATRYRQRTDPAITASAVVHELGKERGLAVGFIGSKGLRFRAAPEQRHDASDAHFTACRGLRTCTARARGKRSPLSPANSPAISLVLRCASLKRAG
jgi:hypothetical protein